MNWMVRGEILCNQYCDGFDAINTVMDWRYCLGQQEVNKFNYRRMIESFFIILTEVKSNRSSVSISGVTKTEVFILDWNKFDEISLKLRFRLTSTLHAIQTLARGNITQMCAKALEANLNLADSI